jgi:excinuclease ABC subunit A
MKKIVVQGAREHNLKNIHVEIPRDKLVVLTGLSGSGKSSLAFDTIYAEGQRRYVESLSAYARQFLEQRGKPDVDSIEGLSPAIAIEQKSGSRNPRSSVGTITEIYDYMRLLWARVGEVSCWKCGQRIFSQTIPQMVDRVLGFAEGMRFSVLAPIVRDKKGDWAAELSRLCREGFVRANIDGELCELAQPPKLDKTQKHTIEVFIDRLVRKAGIEQRLAESIELAVKLSNGLVKISPLEGDDLLFSQKIVCPDCGVSLPELGPSLFSFNNPVGACPACDGIGATMAFDPDLVVVDPDLCLREGAIDPWERRNSAFFQQVLDAVALAFDIDLFQPWHKLPAEKRKIILEGSAGKEIPFVFEKNGRKHTLKKEFEGVLANLQRRFDEYQHRRREQGRNTDEDFEAVYDEFHRYMAHSPCTECGGTRLRKEARYRARGRQEYRRGHRSHRGPGARVHPCLAPLSARLAGLPSHRARGDRAAGLSHQRGRGLLVPGPLRGHALRRRGPAYSPGHPNRQRSAGRALYSRRAVHWLCTSATTPGSSKPWSSCATLATPCWWSSTTKTPSALPTMSSIWGRARASWAGTWWPWARLRKSKRIRSRSRALTSRGKRPSRSPSTGGQ